MARAKGTFEIGSNIEPNMAAPLDARTVVNTVADLIDADSFQYPYVGMIVTVKETGDSYTLTNEDTLVMTSWKKIGSGEGGTSDFDKLTNRPTKEVTPISDIITPLPGTTPRYHKYSSEEQVVGEWIDGKPIYEKTIAITVPNCTNDGSAVYNYISLNESIDLYINIDGFVLNGIGGVVPLPKIGLATSDVNATTTTVHHHGVSAIELLGATNSHAQHPNQLYVSSRDKSYNGFTGYATLQYTKTTD